MLLIVEGGDAEAERSFIHGTYADEYGKNMKVAGD